jgi:hypothetical protein
MYGTVSIHIIRLDPPQPVRERGAKKYDTGKCLSSPFTASTTTRTSTPPTTSTSSRPLSTVRGHFIVRNDTAITEL